MVVLCPWLYKRGWVQIAEQEMLIVAASLVHCCAIKKNVIAASQLYDVADVRTVYSGVDWIEQCFPTFLDLRHLTEGKYNLRYPVANP